MVEVIIVSDGFNHFKTAVEEYLKRLQNSVIVTIIKSVKGKSEAEIIKRESESIKNLLENKKAYTIYCDIKAKSIGTEGLLALVENKQLQGKKVRFLVGGAYGIDDNILKDYIDERISFSACTLPHSLALLVLLEQLYRTESIKKGGKYHHG